MLWFEVGAWCGGAGWSWKTFLGMSVFGVEGDCSGMAGVAGGDAVGNAVDDVPDW